MKPYEIWDFLDSEFSQKMHSMDTYHSYCLDEKIITRNQFDKLDTFFEKDWFWKDHKTLAGKEVGFGILYLNILYKLIKDYEKTTLA